MPSEGQSSSVLRYSQTAVRRRVACRFLLPLRKSTKPYTYYGKRPFPKWNQAEWIQLCVSNSVQPAVFHI